MYDNTLYTYRKNLFGDIIAVYQGSTKVAEYAYDAYGKCTVILNTAGIATINPFRYRSYYFDSDLGLYYLQSRYYDPETGRFINADDVSYLDPQSIHGLNLYAYYLNNPVMYVDPSGNIAVSTAVIGLIVGVVAGLGIALYADYSDDGQVFNGSVKWYEYLFAGIIGGLLGAAIGYIAPAVGGFLNSTFSISIPSLGSIISSGGTQAIASGVTISITGTQIAQGVVTVIGATIIYSIPKHGEPNSTITSGGSTGKYDENGNLIYRRDTTGKAHYIKEFNGYFLPHTHTYEWKIIKGIWHIVKHIIFPG